MFVPFAVFVSVGLQLARVAVAQDDNNDGGGNAPLTIVGLFDSENSVEQQMFELAVQKVNIDPMFSDVYLNAKIQMVDSSDSYKTGVKVCETMESGVAAVFGPSRLDSSNIVQSTCETMQVPRIETSWETTPVERFDYYFNLYPEPTLLSRGYTAIIRDYDWKSFTLLYQHPECLQRLQDLIQHYSRETKPNDNHAAAISIIQLPESRDFRTVLKGIKKSLEGHIVLDCDVELIPTVLKQAKEVNLLDDYHHFIITTLDAHTVEFGGIVQNLRTNITTVRLIDPTCPLVRNIVQDLNFVRQRMNMDTAPLSADKLTVGAMLMHDAVNVYARTVKGLSGRVAAERLRCANGPHTIWSDGYKLINFMRVIETEGLSGLLRFDTKTGHRSYFTLEMVQLVETGFKKIIGLWNPEKGMTYTRTTDEMVQDSYKINKNKTFVVSTKITEPYLMLKENHADLEGNDKYEGYVVDLIEMIAKEINITYEFSLTNEGNGKRDKKTNKWNGIIGQVQSTAADLGVCDLTITHERRTAVDFTMPFMNLGISILFSKPEEPQTNLFSFTQPLSFQVWIFTATAYLGLSLILFFLARITPNEWQNPHPCNPRPEELENSLSLLNCLWFSLGSILCQGSDILPRAFPTRLCAAMWWFFALIMTQSYTANWTAFLTSNRMATTIQNVEDLDKKGGTEGGIKYGCVTDQSTASFFQNSDVNLYQKMWSTMEQNGASVMVSNNNEGVDRVKKERNHYAFFMESSSIEYEVQRNCDLTEVGYWLDNKAYGIAMPFNAQHRTAVDLAVLKLSEAGTLMELKNKWWEVSEDKKCKDSQKGSEELDVNELGGMFVILVLGCLIAFLFSILEFLWNIRKVAVEEKLTLWEAFRVELKFVLKCHGTSKPVRHAVDSSSDT